MEPVSSRRRIRGEGTPESAWQSWPGLAAVHQQLIDPWLPEHGRVVVVAPHPDDEVLGCGALLRLRAARGADSRVVMVTDGEASHGPSDAGSRERLAAARRVECDQGLEVLGIGRGSVVRLGFPDGQVTAHTSSLVDALRRLLRRGDTVVSTWRRDGHPDHDATGVAAERACDAVGCRLLQVPVWMWHWATPGDALVPWHRLHSLHIPAQVLQRKQQALAAHATQRSPREDGSGAVLGDGVIQRAARSTEYFFV